MGFDAVIRAGITLIDGVTKSLQTEVIHFACIGESGFGKEFASGVIRNAIVEEMNQIVTTPSAGDVQIKAKIMILEPILANGAAFRDEPVDPRDEFQLPSGMRGPIVDMPGLVDPSTRNTYFAEIFIGDSRR